MLGASVARGEEALPQRVEFNRDIRPILSDNCFQCHGPDAGRRKADLRLDQEAGAFADLGGRHALVPKNLDDSELYQRIISDDAEERMPPADSGRTLTSRQKELIRRWIEQGAKWEAHWSLISPKRPETPKVQQADWVRNPIDAFVLARLESEGLKPSSEADRLTWLRRVTLDLTGLPPTPAEADAFQNDTSADAHAKVVDRLLDSPRYGERMAQRWLDGARYADTNGYQTDGPRTMWRWRDWVIDAYNRNLPFDRFTIEQLAGDMLPDATLDQQIASGFHRNLRGNAEGGIIPEEYACEYVVDRVETTATVWMGLTLGCTRCHDHKFDPFTQKEFYQLFAFFNNIPERGRAVKFGNSPPMIKAPTREQQAELAKLEDQVADSDAELTKLEPSIVAAQRHWEQSLSNSPVADWTISRNQVAHYALESAAEEQFALPAVEPRGRKPVEIDGRLGRALAFYRVGFLDAGDVANFGFDDKFSCSLWVRNGSGTLVSRMTDVHEGDGWSFTVVDGRLQVNLVKRWLDDAARVESAEAIPAGKWTHVAFTYNAGRGARDIVIYIDGCPAATNVLLDELNQDFTNTAPLRIGGGHGPDGRFHGALDDVRLFSTELTPAEVAILSVSDNLTDLAKIPGDQRSEAQQQKLRTGFLETGAAAEIRDVHQRNGKARAARDALAAGFPTTMVMQELSEQRPAFVLIRGEYDKPGERVERNTPASLLPFPANAPRNRLGLAQWLVDPRHPLTARVAVNRFWQMYFGTGLVKTVDDFGSQGEWPSHPELLDWLAVEFVSPSDGGTPWDIKALQRKIVLSATYRQSSKVTPELWRRDPENRLLARGPRVRLSAETIRDQALAASGLLVEHVGGPSVSPYQPAGLWKELSGTDATQDHGEKLYRRSMYIFWKRTVAPPTMMTFDASARETCTVRETRTNTPLQALTLMNETAFVEAARVLAQRVMHEAATPDERLARAFRLVLGRPPRPAELSVLRKGLDRHLARYQADFASAEKLTSIGEAPPDTSLLTTEIAAYTTMAGLILNLDETVTRE